MDIPAALLNYRPLNKDDALAASWKLGLGGLGFGALAGAGATGLHNLVTPEEDDISPWKGALVGSGLGGVAGAGLPLAALAAQPQTQAWLEKSIRDKAHRTITERGQPVERHDAVDNDPQFLEQLHAATGVPIHADQVSIGSLLQYLMPKQGSLTKQAAFPWWTLLPAVAGAGLYGAARGLGDDKQRALIQDIIKLKDSAPHPDLTGAMRYSDLMSRLSQVNLFGRPVNDIIVDLKHNRPVAQWLYGKDSLMNRFMSHLPASQNMNTMEMAGLDPKTSPWVVERGKWGHGSEEDAHYRAFRKGPIPAYFHELEGGLSDHSVEEDSRLRELIKSLPGEDMSDVDDEYIDQSLDAGWSLHDLLLDAQAYDDTGAIKPEDLQLYRDFMQPKLRKFIGDKASQKGGHGWLQPYEITLDLVPHDEQMKWLQEFRQSLPPEERAIMDRIETGREGQWFEDLMDVYGGAGKGGLKLQDTLRNAAITSGGIGLGGIAGHVIHDKLRGEDAEGNEKRDLGYWASTLGGGALGGAGAFFGGTEPGRRMVSDAWNKLTHKTAHVKSARMSPATAALLGGVPGAGPALSGLYAGFDVGGNRGDWLAGLLAGLGNTAMTAFGQGAGGYYSMLQGGKFGERFGREWGMKAKDMDLPLGDVGPDQGGGIFGHLGATGGLLGGSVVGGAGGAGLGAYLTNKVTEVDEEKKRREMLEARLQDIELQLAKSSSALPYLTEFLYKDAAIPVRFPDALSEPFREIIDDVSDGLESDIEDEPERKKMDLTLSALLGLHPTYAGVYAGSRDRDVKTGLLHGGAAAGGWLAGGALGALPFMLTGKNQDWAIPAGLAGGALGSSGASLLMADLHNRNMDERLQREEREARLRSMPPADALRELQTA